MQGSKKFRVVLLPTLLVLLAMLVVACGSPGATGPTNLGLAPADKQVFHYPNAAISDFGTLDPALVQDATDSYALQTIFTGLVQFKDDGSVVDQLAQSHSVSSDGLTYSFTLKPGLKFSDGTPLTAQDIAYSINRSLDPATKSPVSYYLNLLKDYSKIHSGAIKTGIGDCLIVKDDTHLDILISKPAAYFLQALTYPTSYPVNKKLIDKYADKWTDHLDEGAGDGPFKVAPNGYSHTKGLTVVPNLNYYGAQPKLQRIEFAFSGDTDVTYKAYLSKQYDYAVVPAANLPEAQGRPDFHKTPILVIRYLGMNYLAPPFDDINVRKAFTLAVDRSLITSSVLKGAVAPTNHYVPEGMYGYDPDLKGVDGTTSTAANATMAKQLLSQSKYGSADKLPPITFTYYTGSTNIKNITTALVQQWHDNLGVDVKINAVEFTKLTDLQNQTNNNTGPLTIWINGWQADYPDPQDWLTTFFAKGADYNNQNYGQNNTPNATAQQAVQDQLLKADVTSDKDQRLKLYNDAEQKIANDATWVPLYQSQALSLINPKLHNYADNALQITAPDDWGNIYFTN